MKRTSLSFASAIIFFALLAQAQTPPPPEVDPTVNTDVTTQDQMGDADPLSVIEPKKEPVPPAASVPEFKEIPADGAPIETTQPAVNDKAPPPPTETADAAPAPAKKSKKSKKAKAAVAQASAVGSADPDLDREARFHEIYQRYNVQPTSTEAWEKAMGRAAQVYKVQKGDTLWSVSSTLFGDPYYWPKIWSLNNGSILNPHEISPDMVINFYPGSSADAPTLSTGMLEKEEVEVKTPEGMVIPIKRVKAVTPVLQNLPPSLPIHRIGLDRRKIKAEIIPRPTFNPKGEAYLSYFLLDQAQQGVGQVVETEMGLGSAGEYQYIYVHLTDTSAKTFTVERNLDMLKDPYAKGRQAALIEVQGEIEVLEKVNEEKSLYRALVTKNINPLQVGSFLIPGKMPMVDTDPTTNISQIGAMIIGGQNARERFLFEPNSIVFLNAGSSKGLQVGQTLQVYADQHLRNSATNAIVNDRAVGRVRIVKVTPEFATAYITNSSTDLMIGDYTGHMVKTAREEKAPTMDVTGSTEGQALPTTAPTPGGDDDLEL